MLHPYIGFVRDPQQTAPRFGDTPAPLAVNEYGFFGPPPPLGDEGHLVIGLTGGSVATELFLNARGALLTALRDDPKLLGRKPLLVSIGLDGMKQPQQLMTLNYFLAVGAYFDVIVNLDGFNEVALPFAENLPQGISPGFPRSWVHYTAKAIDLEVAALIAELRALKHHSETWRRRLADSPFWRRSRFALASWHVYQTHTASRRSQLQRQWQSLQALEPNQLAAQQRGPAYVKSGDDLEALFKDFTLLWQRASRQMAQLCEAAGIRYLHLLQPNQHVAASKPLTDWEKRHALAPPRNPYRVGVEFGYPLLRAAGAQLAETGVSYIDFSTIFETRQDTLYKDRCCHFNQRGYELLARAVADAVIKQL